MHRSTVLFAIVLLCSVLLISCQGASGTPDTSAVALLQNVALNVETDQGMVAKASANIGDTLRWIGQTKKAMRASDKAERTFAKVATSDGKEYWIQDVLVGAKAQPAVIISPETVVYAKADVANPSGQIIPVDSIIALHPAGSVNGFVQISAYLEKTNTVVQSLFVKQDAISTDAADVRGLQLFLIASETKGVVQKKELLKSALTTNSRYTARIQAALDSLNSGSVDADLTSNEFSAQYPTNDADVNIRKAPDTNSEVLGKLQKGVLVSIDRRTAIPLTVGSVNAYWYHVKSSESTPAGWVFGQFLDDGK